MSSEAEELEFLMQEEERLRKVIEEGRRKVCDTTLEAETRDIPALKPIHLTARVFAVDDDDVEVPSAGLNLLKLFSYCKPRLCFCEPNHQNQRRSSTGSDALTKSWPRKMWRRFRMQDRPSVLRRNDSGQQQEQTENNSPESRAVAT